MSKYTVLGMMLWLGGFSLVLFQGMSIKTGTEDIWMTLSIVDIFGKQYFQWIDNMSWLLLRQAADYLVSLPLCISLFLSGLFFVVIDGSYRA
ncbi:MAG: hypothetical protein SV775_09510 [Thermodesulfobacteriota bacterium]|nr:hypothetical protein [Thermodesulfobacteriota bacterium]